MILLVNPLTRAKLGDLLLVSAPSVASAHNEILGHRFDVLLVWLYSLVRIAKDLFVSMLRDKDVEFRHFVGISYGR